MSAAWDSLKYFLGAVVFMGAILSVVVLWVWVSRGTVYVIDVDASLAAFGKATVGTDASQQAALFLDRLAQFRADVGFGSAVVLMRDGQVIEGGRDVTDLWWRP